MTNSTSRIDELPPPIRTRISAAPATTELRPLCIGGLQIGFPVVQAALSGYSDAAMRIVARRMGASYTLAEVMVERFVNDLKDRSRTRHHLQISDEEHPVGGQLMGSDPEAFGPAAQKLVAAGFDVIDINFGCPVKSANSGCRGGFHLGQPDVALAIVDRVRDAVPEAIPVTVKMRRGLDDGDVSRERFFRILDGAFARGVAAITVHGRTVEQKYVGPSNWDFLREVKEHAGDKTILGSGDLFTPQACLDMLYETGVDGVTVARGAIGNPWIFQQTRDLAEDRAVALPSLAEQRRVLEMHFDLCLQYGNNVSAVSTMRKFAIKTARLHPREIEVRNAFVAMRNADDWRSALDRWYCDSAIDAE